MTETEELNCLRGLLVAAGCPIEAGCHAPTVVAEWLRTAFVKQPPCAKRLTDAGWGFEWQSEAGFVASEHPLGGKQSVVHVLRVGRTGFDRDEIGHAIAGLLNGPQKCSSETRAKEYRANARLIASAPRLLAMLRRVRAQLVQVNGPQVVRAEFGYLTEAIEEATGEW